MKTRNLIFCLLFLFLGTTIAWADKYYQPGSYKGDTTPRKTLSELAGTGKKFMIYNTAIDGGDDRTGFLRNNGVQFEHDKTKERDLFVYNESFVYTMEGHDDNQDGTNDWYAIKSVNTGLYVNINGKTDIANAAGAKLYITDWDNATNKAGVNMENRKYNIVANGQITSSGNGSTVHVVKNGDTCWNGNVNAFATLGTGHPYAFYEAHEVTSGDYLEDLHIYSRCDLYSAQVIYGYIKDASQITSNHPFTNEGDFSRLLDGDPTTYNVTNWHNNSFDEHGYHYYQIDLGEEVSSLYLCMQRRADGKNAPTKYELQASTDANGGYKFIGDYTTDLADTTFYASGKIELGASYQYIRIVAKERTTTNICMGLSELYVLPSTNEIDDAIKFVNMANQDPLYKRTTAKSYAAIVEKYNATCPDAKLLSGVPLPGNKYRIYADAYNIKDSVYVNREIKAGEEVDGTIGLEIKAAGSYHDATTDQEKYEWYCELTSDGYLVFRNVSNPGWYLGMGQVETRPYKWSISTLGTQRHGVPLMNIAQQYLAMANDGTYFMGNVRGVQNQTVAPVYVDGDNNAETLAEEVASGLCTDFVFIPVPLEGEEKKITITGNDLVKRNTKLLFDSDGDGIKEVLPLPYSRMYVGNGKFQTLELQLLCNDIHKYKGIKVKGSEVLNTEIASLNGNVLTFDYTKVKNGHILDIQLEIEKPFKVMSAQFDVTQKPSLYLIRNKRQQSVMQQARPRRANVNIEIGGDDTPISSQTGQSYYAKFNQRDADMILLNGSPKITEFSVENLNNKLVTDIDAASLFYFTATEDEGTAEYYNVNINNVTTVMKCADRAAWNANGNTWYVQPKSTESNKIGYNIGRTPLDATNNPEDAWCSNHENGDKIVTHKANDDGAAWEFVPVSDEAAKELLKGFIDKVAEKLVETLEAKKDESGIDQDKVGYYSYIVTTMKERADTYYRGETINDNGEIPIAKLLQFAQNIHMVEHEIKYALFQLPELSNDVVDKLSQLDDSSQPHWYYIRNVKGTNETTGSYVAFAGNSKSMELQQYGANDGKKLANMFYFVGEKNSYASVAVPNYEGTDKYTDYPGNNLIIDEYLKAHIHNFMAKEVTLVSKNVMLTEKIDIKPGYGQQTVAKGLNLKSNENWSLELEYDLAGNTSFNAYGSCLLASGGDPLTDNYFSGFQVYLKDDHSLVIKVNNGDDRYRFWHTQSNLSHIKVVITYSHNNVVLDVYNSLGQKETKVIENVTMNDITQLTSALPAEGATISRLATYSVEEMTWKPHEKVQSGVNKDDWYILPSSNTDYPGLAVVLGEPCDTRTGWTNNKGENQKVVTDLGTADNSTWVFERVTDFDAHVDELIKMYDFKDCVIYDKELAKLFTMIAEKEAAIKENENGDGEEAMFNELYYAFLNYKGRLADELKAPKPGSLYTIRSLVEANTENALLVHTDWTNGTHTSKEVYLDDVVLDDNSCDSRAAWVFDGEIDGDGFFALDGLRVKNLHTQCYLTALGADASFVAEENPAQVTLGKLGACTTMFKVGDYYMNRTTSTGAVRYAKESDFWGSAITEYPEGVRNVHQNFNAGYVCKKSFEVLVDTKGDVSITLTHNGGNHKLNILGANLVDLNGKIAKFDYEHRTAGGDPTTQTYSFADVNPGAYTLNCYVWNFTGSGSGDDKVKYAQGDITFSGISQIAGAAKVANNGTENSKWIIEEIMNPEESIYYNVASLSAGTQPDTKAYSSLYLGFDAKLPDGITAWIVTGVETDNKLLMEEVKGGIVPANTGLILSSENPMSDQKFKYSLVASQFDATENMLTGTAYTKLVDCSEHDVYMLGKKSNRVALYWVYENRDENGNKLNIGGTTNHNKGGYVLCNANKAYMLAGQGSQANIAMYSFFYGGITTDIDEITETADNANNSGIFDLQGRKLDEITEPGIYIVNGKKVFVDNIE